MLDTCLSFMRKSTHFPTVQSARVKQLSIDAHAAEPNYTLGKDIISSLLRQPAHHKYDVRPGASFCERIVQGPLLEPKFTESSGGKYAKIGAIRIDKEIAADYLQAREYLSNDPNMRSFLLQAEQGYNDAGKAIRLTIKPGHPQLPSTEEDLAGLPAGIRRTEEQNSLAPKNRYQSRQYPQLDEILWNSKHATMTADGKGYPAAGSLGHEMTHLFLNRDNPHLAKERSNTKIDEYGDLDERDVMDIENRSFANLGDGVRANHYEGVKYPAYSASTTDGIKYPQLVQDAKYTQYSGKNTSTSNDDKLYEDIRSHNDYDWELRSPEA